MTTVSDFVDPIFLSGRVESPVILESCFHTFAKEGTLGTIYTCLRTRISRWDFRVPKDFECAVCKQNFQMEQVVYNGEWEKLSNILDRFIRTEKGEESAEDFERRIKKMPLIELPAWDRCQAVKQILVEWQAAHYGQKIDDVKVVDFLKWKEVPLVRQLLEAWKIKHPSNNFEMLYLTDLIREDQASFQDKSIDIFNDLRPDHLLGYDAHNRDEEKIRNAPTRRPVFEVEEWSYFESLQFIATSIYHFAVALLCEVSLYILYFWECGFLTTKQYDDLRESYVINRIMPLYIKYMGLPPEKPKTD